MSKYNVILKSTTIAHQWWGKKWCENVGNYADYRNRLERGRTYVRGGRVNNITIEPGLVCSTVNGRMPEPYTVNIKIDEVSEKQKEGLLNSVSNLNALANGQVPENYQQLFAIGEEGFFPQPEEIHISCSCPDSAVMCKHVAATLYAVGSILDQEPLILFKIRGVNVESYLEKDVLDKTNMLLRNIGGANNTGRSIDKNLISDIFGIDLKEIHTNSVSNDESTIDEDAVRVIEIIPPKRDTLLERKSKKEKAKPRKQNDSVIRQYDMEGIFIAEFSTYDEAERITGIARRAIQRAICGEKKSGGGYMWRKSKFDTPIDNIAPYTINVNTTMENNSEKPVVNEIVSNLCPNCGEIRLPKVIRFCPKCGLKISGNN